MYEVGDTVIIRRTIFRKWPKPPLVYLDRATVITSDKYSGRAQVRDRFGREWWPSYGDIEKAPDDKPGADQVISLI